MSFKLSQRSLDKLEGVHPDMVKCVKSAIEYTKVDFGVICGMRTEAEQRELVDKGATVKFNEDIVAFIPSRHLEKEDGTKLKKGEDAEFVIIEFSKEFKRVVASHTEVFKAQEVKNVRAVAKKSAKASLEAKTTLGDANEALQALKDKMNAK